MRINVRNVRKVPSWAHGQEGGRRVLHNEACPHFRVYNINVRKVLYPGSWPMGEREC